MKTNPVRLSSALMCLAAFALPGGSARAKPAFLQTFKQTYSPRAGTPLAKAECRTCHAAGGPPRRNPYGELVEAALKRSGAKAPTPALLRGLEKADADADGWNNGAEIAAGNLPGDPRNHPTAAPYATPSSNPNAMRPKGPAGKSGGLGALLFPMHSFHPVLVHFPIALFLIGGFLELLGAWLGRSDFKEAGYINLVVASLASLAAVATGVVALYRNGFPFEGTLRTHILVAVAATLVMGGTVYLGWGSVGRRGGRLYWALLLAGMALVGAAGFFGGMFVYG